jgi:serine/threonine protein kinase
MSQLLPDDRQPVVTQDSQRPSSPQLDQLIPFPPGTCLDGKYVIEGELGRGGFGIVLLAREIGLDNREVALKLPRPDLEWKADQIAKFRDEARKVARLNERGIPTIYQILDVTVRDKPTVCVVQQYIPGTSLSRWWKMRQGTPDAYDQLAEMLADIAVVLARPHAKSLFHRDLKPDNVLVDLEDNPYVLDFGLALHVNERKQEAGSGDAFRDGSIHGA